MAYARDVTESNVDSAVLTAIEHLIQNAAETAGDNTAITVGRDNPTARVDGASVNSVPLAAASTPYIKATVQGYTAATDANTAAVINTGDIRILTTADDIQTASAPLAPGQSMALPDNCDLANLHLAVDILAEGVLITYTT